MIRRYVFGQMIETDTVQKKPEAETGALPFFAVDEEKHTFTRTMDDSEIVYGLGENVRGVNKRGWIYRSLCSDDPNQTEDRQALYCAHNFFVVDGTERFGVFLDYPGTLTFDFGYTAREQMQVTASDWNLDVYIVTGESLKDIVKQFRRLIGRSYIPPLWAFGFGQSRYSYMNEDEVREVVEKYRESGIPFDSIYLDIDYMDGYRDFTVNGETFPDFPAFVQEMKEKNVHLVPIIDAGVKREDGYGVYDDGVKKGAFCVKEDGTPFVGAVWPGEAVFPDVLNKEARAWFGDNYKILLDQGIDGFWNDMNEPSIFYTPERLKQAFETVESMKGQKLARDSFFKLMFSIVTLNNNPEDYKTFYHNMDGRLVRHDLVHNLFGYNMTRAAGEAFERLVPDKRILMFSRSSCIGMHRYGGMWQGDNKAWWSHLLMNLKEMPSLNMCGFLYTGADIGGFGSDTTEDLMLRWLALGVFTPLMRSHAAMRSRFHETYLFGDQEAFRSVISTRYRLLPYIYSEYMKAAIRDEMMFRPLAFDYTEDERARTVEDQMLVGDSIMIAPVCEQNAAGRTVYLPEPMKLVRFGVDGVTEEVLPAGDRYVPVALSDVILFIRPNRLIPLSSGGQCVEDVDFENVELLSFGAAEYEYYRDNGFEKTYDDPKHITVLRTQE